MYHAQLLRWMYRGHHPNRVAKFLNRISAMVASLGITPRLMVSLEVVGRRTGNITTLPLVIVYRNHRRYLVSMLGSDVQWVKNVEAAQGKAVIRSGNREEVILKKIPTEQRAPILKEYLQRAPGARPHMPISKNAPLADFEQNASNYPVFEVTAADETARR
jgi:hypothetical protein